MNEGYIYMEQIHIYIILTSRCLVLIVTSPFVLVKVGVTPDPTYAYHVAS